MDGIVRRPGVVGSDAELWLGWNQMKADKTHD
jgi:hypothetical protein